MSHLKLKAQDNDDLAVLSACWQDAIVTVQDIIWEREAMRFGFVGHRFCWEDFNTDGTKQRTLSRLWFEDVKSVQFKNFDPKESARVLPMLAIEQKEPGTIQLTFAEDACIRVHFSGLNVYSQDLEDPWPCTRCPEHDKN